MLYDVLIAGLLFGMRLAFQQSYKPLFCKAFPLKNSLTSNHEARHYYNNWLFPGLALVAN